MAFLDLSVKGKASPRHTRLFSGKRSGYDSQNVNTKASIFGISEPKTQYQPSPESPKRNSAHGSAQSSQKYKTPDAPRESGVITISSSAGVITQSELRETRKNLGLIKSDLPEEKHKEFQVDGKWFIDKPRRPRSRKAPQGVPKLQLGTLSDKDDELKKPLSSRPCNLATPDSQTSVSWGTPVDNHYYDHPNEEKNYQICNEEPGERLMSDQRKKPTGVPDLDLQLSHSGNEQFRKALRERNKLEQEKKYNTENTNTDNVAHPWVVQPQKGAEKLTKVADEKAKLRQTRKNEIIDEALFGDELTKEKIAKPEVVPPSYNTREMGPRERRHQALFNRNPTATAPNSENLLSQRIRFSARVLSKDGHDARRELNGFFFPGDNTLTIYEFRQFGSRSSALPFVQRGQYYHARGHAKGEAYSFEDIAVGNDLLFETSEQLSLPDNLKRKPYVTLRITDVDKEAKRKLAFRDRPSPIGVVNSSHHLLQRPLTKDESKDREVILKVKALVRTQLKKRGVKSMTALGRYFQSLDKTGDGLLDKDELKEALKKFNIQIPPENFEHVWNIVDVNHDGALDYGEFTRNFIGEMNENRKALVLKVFRKMDPNKRGVITLMNMTKFFSARQHSHVISGKVTEDEVRQQLLSSFEHCKRQEVTYAEFEDYFEGLSLTIDSDEEFIMIMRNCWGV